MAEAPEPDMRLPYAAMRSEGQDPCVIGPKDEIVVEVGSYGSPEHQYALAARIAAMLNEDDFNHSCCSSEGRALRARYTLVLIDKNGIRDAEAMEFISATVEEAQSSFARDQLDQRHGEVPF